MKRTLASFIVLFIAASAVAQAPTSFREGVLAFEKKEWKNAERLMRETIAANPKESEGTVSIAGSWFETYVPHYFLARALARQGKCAEALKEFEESERQGVTPTIPDFARHLQTRGGCKPQAKAAKPKEIVFETSVPFAEESTTTALSAPSAKPPVVVKPAPKETTPARAVVTPREAAAPARDYERESSARSRLAIAVTAYLHGKYDETARILTENKFDDPAAAAEAALFRAAARYAMHRMGGEKDASLRELVDADLQQYRNLRPNSRPDPRLFPPGFIALIQQARQ